MEETNPQKSELCREDWDFSGVPNAELHGCFLYECFREWPQAVKRAEEFERFKEPFPYIVEKSRFPMERYVGVRDSLCLAVDAVRSSVATDVPWQRLDPQIRTAVYSRQETGLFFGPATEKRERPLTGADIGHDFNITLNWLASDHQILKEFEQFLKEQRLYPAREIRGTKPGDWLKMIGAMRLLHHHHFNQAFWLTSEVLGAPLYNKRPSWERARKGALEAFRNHFFLDWRVFSAPFPKSYPKFRPVSYMNP